MTRLILLGALLWLAAGGCAGQANTTEEPPAQIVFVERGDILDRLQIGGQIAVQRHAKLSFDLPVSQQVVLRTVEVKVGQFVEAGATIATIDATALERAVTEAEADLQAAQKALEKVSAPAKPSELALARVAVTRARTDLRMAERALEKVEKPNLVDLQAEVADAELALILAEQNLRGIEQNTEVGKHVRDLEYAYSWQQRRQLELTELASRNKANLEQLADLQTLNLKIVQTAEALGLAREKAFVLRNDAHAGVKKATDDLANARKTLAEAQAGGSALDLAKGRDAIAAAQLAVQEAEEAEAKLKAGPDAEKRALAEADVADKQRALLDAKAGLGRTRLVSPFAGFIAQLPAQVGEFISSRTVVAEISDLKSIAVAMNLDETEVPKLSEGMAVSATMDAFPGKKFTGVLGAIPLQGKLENERLIFPALVTVDFGDVSPKPGMSVLLAIEIGRADQALRLPSMAIQSDADGAFVLMGAESGRRQAIKTGVSDGTYTQILAGLQERDLVIVPANTYKAQGIFGSGVVVMP